MLTSVEQLWASGRQTLRRQLGGDVPGQQIIDFIDRMLCDALEHTAQVGLAVEIVELGGANEAVDCSATLTPSSEPAYCAL
jgi:hypothetical protein